MKILLSENEVQYGVKKLARQVSQAYAGGSLTILGVMTGSVVLLADLIRQLDLPLRVGVIQASSYRQGTTHGKLVINADLMPDIRGRDVLVIDDIFDTGKTLVEVKSLLTDLKPNSLRTAVLLCKQGRAEVEYRPDFQVFEIPDEFVVGYGLDYRDAYRNLPYIGYLTPEEIAGPAP